MSFYRTPKTMNEMSQTAVMMLNDDVIMAGVRIRAKRQPHNLLNAWDDLPKCIDKSWKRQRKTHYLV